MPIYTNTLERKFMGCAASGKNNSLPNVKTKHNYKIKLEELLKKNKPAKLKHIY